MNKSLGMIVMLVVGIMLLLLAIRGCQKMKEMKFKQKSNDTATQFSIEIEKQQK